MIKSLIGKDLGFGKPAPQNYYNALMQKKKTYHIFQQIKFIKLYDLYLSVLGEC